MRRKYVDRLVRFLKGDAVKTHHIDADTNSIFGFKMGLRLRGRIQKIIKPTNLSRFHTLVRLEAHKIRTLELFPSLFSYYFSEMIGLAYGADVFVKDIVALNLFEDEVWGQPSENCSLVFFRTRSGVLIGWNEDGNRNYAGKMSLIHARLAEMGLTDLEFITLNYPGLLCGDTLAITSNGLVIALQSLSPVLKTKPVGLSRGLVGRILLEANSLKEISFLLHNLKDNVKHGVHLFAYDIKSGCGESFEMFPGYLFSKSVSGGQKFFAHTNHYLENLNTAGLDQNKSESSRVRLGYLEKFESLNNPTPETVADILSNRPPISGLQSSSQFNICRAGERTVTTLHSQVLLIEKNKNPVLWTSPGNPADCRFEDWQKQKIKFVTA